MIIGVVKETFPDERRVAVIPAAVPGLLKEGLELVIQAGAGQAAGFPDPEYQDKGVRVVADRAEIFAQADGLLQVRTVGANPEQGQPDLALHRTGQVVIGCAEPLTPGEPITTLAERGVALFAMELMPRITRAQSMDTLSSMASIAGYQAVLIAAEALPKMFPMMMTAAGTIKPARVFVMGAGVAGLQAIATAKRLGAVVLAYDVRPAVKEQVESLGAKFVELELEAGTSEDKGGYAKEMGEEFYRRQREKMLEVVADSDVVITTAAVPGKKAPILLTTEMVHAMKPGTVVVDMAAERGGNCELTRVGETVDEGGVMILGPVNLPATIPFHASQMYSRNLQTFLQQLISDGEPVLDLDDEVLRETLITRDGEVVHTRVRQLLGLAVNGQAGE